MTKKWLVALLSAAAMTFSAGAMAQAALSGAYVGLDVGQTDFGPDDDTGFKIFGGYRFHPNIAAELAYGMLVDKGANETTSLEAAAVGMFPVANQISIFGKLGLALLDNGADETELTYGIGVQYDATRNLGLRAQWQRYSTDPDDIDFLSIGVLWKF